jgi:ketosteroid isomerase-like protein
MPRQSTEEQIRRLAHDWAQAKQSGDVTTLENLTVEDFQLVGPLGFVLDKQAWLDRYRSGALVTETLTLDELAVRCYGQTAITIERRTQQASYRGHRSDGLFRATHTALHRGGRWRLAGIQLSSITQPPSVAAGSGPRRALPRRLH